MLHNQRQNRKLAFESKRVGVVGVAETSKRIADLAQRQPAQLRALEHRHGATAARPLARALANAEADATGRWMLATTATQAVPRPADLQALIEHIRKALEAAFHGQGAYAMAEAQRAAYTAAALGLQHASRITELLRGVPSPQNVPAETGPVSERAAGAIPAAVAEEHSHALALENTPFSPARPVAVRPAAVRRARAWECSSATAAGMAPAARSETGPVSAGTF